MDFQERLKTAIKAKGYKLEELANKTGVTVQTLVNWKKGRHEPTFFDISCLAEVLGISLDWLAWGDKNGKVQM